MSHSTLKSGAVGGQIVELDPLRFSPGYSDNNFSHRTEGVSMRPMLKEEEQSWIVCRLSEAAAAELAAIEAESNSPPWSEALFASEAKNTHSTIFGARGGGELLGFIVFQSVADEAHILNFGVLKRFRGRGVGRALLEECIRALFRSGVQSVYLEVRRSNIVAQELYASCGFVTSGERVGYYADNKEDAITMRLDVGHKIKILEAEE